MKKAKRLISCVLSGFLILLAVMPAGALELNLPENTAEIVESESTEGALSDATAVHFEFGGTSAYASSIATVPYPSELNASWSDNGFYAWQYAGDFYLPGTADVAGLDGQTLTAVMIADYNASLPEKIINENGILLYKDDFNTAETIRTFNFVPTAYSDPDYVTDPKRAPTTGTWSVVEDETGAGKGSVLKGTTTGASQFYYNCSTVSGAGTYTFTADYYSTVPAYRVTFGGVTTNGTVATGTWQQIKIAKTVSAANKINFFVNTTEATGGTHYADNICFYWLPENTVVFDNNAGGQALYYADGNGNITIPAPSGVNANWSDNGFVAWTSTGGSVYRTGDVVAASALIGQALVNRVSTVNFSFNGGTASTMDVSAMPYPSELNASWSDAGFYGWTLDGTIYRAGEAGDMSVMADQTLTPVMIADYNATLPAMLMDENGIVLYKNGFDTVGSLKNFTPVAMPYRNTTYVASANGTSTTGTWAVVEDDTGAGKGTVLKGETSGASQYYTPSTTTTSGAGTYTFTADFYSTISAYYVLFGNVRTNGTVTPNTWQKIKVSKTLDTASTINFFPNYSDSTAATHYIDNFCFYWLPENTVVFDNNAGEQALYYADGNGNITIPAPSGVNANWSNDGFYCWMATDGTMYDVGETVTLEALTGVALKAVPEDANKPLTFGSANLKTVGVCGIRFSAFVSPELKSRSTEYGFLVARGDQLGETDLVFPEGFDSATEGGTNKTGFTPSGKRFLCGSSYVKDSEVDLFYLDELDGENGFRFTAKLMGLTTKQHFTTNFVVRPYAVVAGAYFYGALQSQNAYALAQELYAAGDESEFVTNIINACAD